MARSISAEVTVIRAITNLRAIAERCEHKTWNVVDVDVLAKELAVALDNVATALDAIKDSVKP